MIKFKVINLIYNREVNLRHYQKRTISLPIKNTTRIILLPMPGNNGGYLQKC